MKIRVIARLDVKPPYVVKPVHFEGLRKMGKPEEMALKYYTQGADEIIYIDIVSSLYRRPILSKIILATAKNLFIPFAAGGGVKTIEDFSLLLHNGVDKVVINTYALQEDPKIIERAAKVFGSQAVVVQVEAKKWQDWWECYSDCGRIRSSKDVFEWVKTAEDLGAGEIILSSVDRDGRKAGFDIELIKEVVSELTIPVIAASGAGSLNDIKKMIQTAKPDAVAIGSLLHYNITTINEIKEYLHNNGIKVAI
ncbi:MAG: imidazole glycerol phosphate synthase cyclase subunit [Methanoregula sp.]